MPEKIKIWSENHANDAINHSSRTGTPKKTERTMTIADNGKRETDAQDSQKPSQRSNFSARIGERRPGTLRAGRRPHLAHLPKQQRLIDEHGRRSAITPGTSRGERVEWHGGPFIQSNGGSRSKPGGVLPCASYDRIRVRATRVRSRGGAVQKAGIGSVRFAEKQCSG